MVNRAHQALARNDPLLRAADGRTGTGTVRPWDQYRLEFEKELREMRSTGRLSADVVKRADHVFTLLWAQERLIDLITGWVEERDSAHLVDRRDLGGPWGLALCEDSQAVGDPERSREENDR